jgi:hypothetical protein
MESIVAESVCPCGVACDVCGSVHHSTDDHVQAQLAAGIAAYEDECAEMETAAYLRYVDSLDAPVHVGALRQATYLAPRRSARRGRRSRRVTRAATARCAPPAPPPERPGPVDRRTRRRESTRAF